MIRANFYAYGSYVTDSLYQWDKNQDLVIGGLNLTVAPEIHFSNTDMERAIVRQSTLESGVVTVRIPNSLLQVALTIKAYIGIYEGDTFKVIETIEIPVIAKTKPTDYTFEDSDGEIYSFNKLENEIVSAKSEITRTVENKTKTLEAQIANIIAHNNDTEGNTELIDIRTGADGTVYDTAGNAIRTQFENIDDKVDSLTSTTTKRTKQIFNKVGVKSFNGFVHSSNRGVTPSPDVLALAVPVSSEYGNTVRVQFTTYGERFIVGTTTDKNPSVGSPIVNWYALSRGQNEYNFTIDDTIKNLVITYWHISATVTPKEVIDSIMIHYGDSHIDYEPYYLPINETRITALEEIVTTTTQNINDIVNFTRVSLGNVIDKEYAEEIAEEANNYVGDDRHTFLFVTDTHTQNNSVYVGDIVAEMTKLVPCRYIIHGGDIIDGLTEKKEELATLVRFNRALSESRVPVLYSKGNHDDNCIYARNNGKAIDKYIFNREIYSRTNAFNLNIDRNDDMYYFIDDEQTKVRTIVLNGFNNPENATDGVRDEDAKTRNFGENQYQWLYNSALDFSTKENPSEWGVVVVSHYADYPAHWLWYCFANGLKYTYGDKFKTQGPIELIAWFVGDDHLDGLRSMTEQTSGHKITIIHTLNASPARDGTGLATETSWMLEPPIKTRNTNDRTAFDIVSIDRANKLIYLTRYGARSYSYNSDTGACDKLVARTRVINYQTAEYTVLT